MIATGVLPLDEAYRAIDYRTIVLLFGMMVLIAHLQMARFFRAVVRGVAQVVHQPTMLLVSIVFVSGLLSALFVNDTVCLVFTPILIEIAEARGHRPLPYLLALATASNIGSVATITGNPQNMLIGSVAGIPYVEFIAHLGPVALVGLCLNWAVLHRIGLRGAVDSVEVAEALSAPEFQRPPLRKKPVIVLMLVLVGFLTGTPAALVAAVGAALLLITRTVEPRNVYDEVDWGLLVFFIGLFVIVGGAERAGLTATLLRPIEAWNLDRLPVFVPVTALLSNIVSNVPAVMLLRTVVSGFPNPHAGWLALAMSSTLAGNLTITGSVANIIVLERAAAEGVHVGFDEYFRIGLPVTVSTLVCGSVWLWAIR
jgi:Na+/H+ antiporter NhaD/arsenite permease-like protein